MRIIILIYCIFALNSIVYASVADYINSIEGYTENQSYKSFTSVIKGEASISDIEKQVIIDKEISEELNSPFIFTDLSNCIKIGLEKNYNIKIYNQYKKEAYWLHKNAQFQLLPDIYYNFDIKNLEGRYLVGGIVTTTTHEVPIQSLTILEWSTINQGKYFFLLAQTKNLFKSSVANLEFEKEKIIRDVVLAYYDVLEKKLEMEVQKVNIYDRLEQLKYTKARFDIGIGTLYDVKRAQAELAGAQQDYTTTINSLRLRQASLANVIGIDILDAIYPFEITVDIRQLVDSKLSIDDLYEQALESREDIKSKISEIEAYKAVRSSNYTDIIPEITLAYQNGYVGTVSQGLSAHNSLTFDIRAHLGKNLLMGTITKVKADNAVVKAKKNELIDLKRQVKENILNYYYDSLNALKKIEAAKVETEAADVSLDLSLANMKAGEATFIDVISSQNLKVHANINLIKNMIEYNKAQTKLLFEIGLISSDSVIKNYRQKFY